MYKSKSRSITLLILLLFSFMIFTACDKDSVNESPLEDSFNSSEFAVFDFDDAMSTVQGGTEGEEFGFNGPLPGEKGFHRGPDPQREGRHLGKILWLLELNDEQKETVKSYVEQNHECTKTAFDDFKTAVEPILKAANEQRQELIEQYNNGEITNEELYFALKELREQTHSQIENNAEVQGAKQAICDCKINLLDNIGSILNQDQLTIWSDWLSNLDGPCFE